MTYVAGYAVALPMYYADNIDGMFYALSMKMEKFSDIAERTAGTAAAYIATEHPNLAAVYVVEGWRKEQVAEAFQKRLDWDDKERYSFAEMLQCLYETSEGRLFPTMYIVPRDAGPADVKDLMVEVFEGKVDTSTEIVASTTPLNMDKIIVIASLIQREAAGKKDMGIISGVIWNRIMKNMSLDIDATLQYVKGTEGNWWPEVKSEDKFADSPYNTYQNKGLPPHPIANPGLAAITAALNPTKTSCLYYLHDAYGRIHCSATYEGHKRNINLYLR